MKNFFVDLPATLFFVLIATVPIQLGKHFWPNFANVLGFRIDFLSPAIFLTDIAIFTFILSCAIRFFITKKFPPKNLTVALILFLVGIGVGAVFSTNKFLSFWFWAKFAEFTALAAAVSSLPFGKIYPKTGRIFAVVTLLSVFLAFWQFQQQQSVGLWFLGERTFNLTTPGISKIDLEGVQILRPYATFPHPNVLAGFLVLSIFVIFFSNLKKFIKLPTLILVSFGLFLTFSRSAWIGLIFAAVVTGAVKFNWQKAAKWIVLVFLILAFLLLIFPKNPITLRFWQIGKSDAHSLILRTKLAKAAVKMFFTSPLTGTGPGNFLPNLPKFWDYEENIRFLQPVHNLPLLVLAETGVIGFASLAFLLWTTFLNFFKNFKKAPNFLLPCWIMILLISLVDHYFWTLQQGQILFWLILGLSWTAK